MQDLVNPLVMPLEKKCTMCKKTLPIENFAKCDRYGNRRGKCKPCHTEQKQREKGTWEEYQKEKSYKEELHILQKQGKRRCRMCDEIKVLDEFPSDFSRNVHYNKKSYCKKCAYKTWRIPAQQTEHYKKLKRKWDRKYQQNNKEKINAQYKKRYHSDTNYKLKTNLRTRLGQVLRNHNIGKTVSSLELVGCEIDFLKKYLESKFKKGMTWDNWSMYGWHIDHVIPLSSFDLSKLEEQKKAMHYTNLQPLWAKENLKKGDKVNVS